MLNQKDVQADELFFVVDDQDQPLAPLPRKLVHGHGVWHRVSHVWLFNDDGQVLCQQRSLQKELSPGKWEPFFGGHLDPSETYLQGAIRETAEEVGVTFEPDQLKLWKIYKHDSTNGYNNEFQAIYIATWNGDTTELTPDPEEVEAIAWMDVHEVQSHFEAANDAWIYIGYELDLLKELS